jgi:hypothetical protein
MIRVVERAKKLLLKITIVGYIKALSPIVYNEEKCKRRELGFIFRSIVSQFILFNTSFEPNTCFSLFVVT